MPEKTNADVYRPIQYLGAKNRSLSAIVRECSALWVPGSYILDLFSGSSVVSQALYNKGFSVISNDAMCFCQDMATCMMNIGRKKDFPLESVKQQILSYDLIPEYIQPFIPYIAEEKHFLMTRDLEGLKRLYQQIPQVGNNEKCSEQIEFISKHYGENAYGSCPLIANYYAGSYFGIRQALDLDSIRSCIESLYSQTTWEKALMLTALYNTLSVVVNSAGKHFAQPLSIHEGEEKLINERILGNRLFSVKEVFIACLEGILFHVNSVYLKNNIHNNISLCEKVGDQQLLKAIEANNVSVVYADPPYTAQQYSRFYHIPEVLHSYCYPKLQYVNGKTTMGRYPELKYQSDFCSKRKARTAFASVFEIARRTKSSLVISYSESKGSTGNERMISREELKEIALDYLPEYNCSEIQFDFKYRQLNKRTQVVKESNDLEFLLVFAK